jgi:uncharacterized protein YbjT (DUF2867 family)
VGGDLSLPNTLDGRLDGVDAVFLLWNLMTADAAPGIVDTIAKHARRIVFLSSSAVRDGIDQQGGPIARLHDDIERLIERSGLEWTFLRPGGFAANARWWWAPQIRIGDVVRWPYRAATWAPIHERDIAAVAVSALSHDGHAGKKYVLTGPQLLTQADQVRTIGEAIGRPLRFEEMSPETARPQLLDLLPPAIVDVLLDAFAGMATEPAPVAGTVAEVAGAPPRTFRGWVIDNAGDFRRGPENGRHLRRRDSSPAQGQIGGPSQSNTGEEHLNV